ncbi:MAG: hypothetical protein GXP33_11430 [Spirochaetes bacterium]|nr:hypothetical protein [Spirochaetota bacterium]
MKRLIDYIIEQRVRYLAIIGLAKNTGKTVTFNKIIDEAIEIGLEPVLMSYGRDGEKIDAVTRQKKPRIRVPPGCIFITAAGAYEKSDITASLIEKTGFNTVLGDINIYRSAGKGGEIELVGVNSNIQLKKIKKLIRNRGDLFLIDGAIDRRSSAVPLLTDGFVLATGAVVGNTEELVVKKTLDEVRKLTLPKVDDPVLIKYARDLFEKGEGAVVEHNYKYGILTPDKTFGNIQQIKSLKIPDPKALILNGALVNVSVEELIFSLKLKNCKIIVKDFTRVFLDTQNLNLLKNCNIELLVLLSNRLVAVTANPSTPYGINLDSNKLVKSLRINLNGTPVYDLLNEEYRSIN